MKQTLLLLPLLLLFACGEPNAQTQTDEPIVGRVDAGGKLGQGPKVNEDTGRLLLRMGSAEAPQNARVCLPVEATGFQDLIGFQYTMRFDSAALRFEEFRGFNLPGYGPSNFGDRFAERGYLSTLWTDANLQGQSYPDGRRLFEVCFTNLQPAGETTEVRFADGPTAFEVINKDMRQMQLVYGNGAVSSVRR